MGTVKVLGQGEVKFAPDVTRVSVEIEARHTTHQAAFDAGIRNTNHIKDILAEYGLDRDLVKITRFDVNKHEVNKKVDKGQWEWVVIGYDIKQSFIIELEIGCPQLTALISQIGKEISGVEIELGFAVKDVESAKLKVIEAAVKDAQRKAEVMATALGKKLGEVTSVICVNSDDDYYYERIYRRGRLSKQSVLCNEDHSLDITPVDLDGNANVEVVWDLV